MTEDELGNIEYVVIPVEENGTELRLGVLKPEEYERLKRLDENVKQAIAAEKELLEFAKTKQDYETLELLENLYK